MAGREKVDLQVRGVPRKLQRRIRENAARKGVSMSRYVIQILEDNVDRPESIDAWLDEVRSHPVTSKIRPGEPTAIIRAMRDAIDRA
jgi:hypothetical protein